MCTLTECDAAVRRGAEIERAEQVLERPRVEMQHAVEHVALERRVVQPDRAAAHFVTVQREVVMLFNHLRTFTFTFERECMLISDELEYERNVHAAHDNARAFSGALKTSCSSPARGAVNG